MQELNQIVDADGRRAPFHRPDFASQSGQKHVVFWPNVVLNGSLACRVRIDWCLAEVIEAMHFAVDNFFSYSIFLDDIIEFDAICNILQIVLPSQLSLK